MWIYRNVLRHYYKQSKYIILQIQFYNCFLLPPLEQKLSMAAPCIRSHETAHLLVMRRDKSRKKTCMNVRMEVRNGWTPPTVLVRSSLYSHLSDQIKQRTFLLHFCIVGLIHPSIHPSRFCHSGESRKHKFTTHICWGVE